MFGGGVNCTVHAARPAAVALTASKKWLSSSISSNPIQYLANMGIVKLGPVDIQVFGRPLIKDWL